jgi:hypothetical protein
MAHHVVVARLRMAASGRSRHQIPGRPPRLAGSRSISRSNDHSTEPANGLGPSGLRSLRQKHWRPTPRMLPRRKESGLEPLSRLHAASSAASWQAHQLIADAAKRASRPGGTKTEVARLASCRQLRVHARLPMQSLLAYVPPTHRANFPHLGGDLFKRAKNEQTPRTKTG